MADINKKQFLDYEGLALYNELIKNYIDSKSDTSSEEILQELATYKTENDARHQANEQAIEVNKNAIEVLNGDKETEGSILNAIDTVVGDATQEAVDTAISNLVANAPEALDTLKEIADWIANDETGTEALVQRVSDIEDAAEALAIKEEEDIAALTEKEEADIADLKAYVDTQDSYYWNHITSIELMKVNSLFAEEQKAGQTAIEAIMENKAVVLKENQIIAEDIVIDDDKYINGNGATFEGQVTVPSGANVVIENATFAKPVIVA